MRVEFLLSIKESIRLEAALGEVGETLVSSLTAAHVCRLAAKYVISLTLESSVMTFIVLSGVGYADWLA